MGAAAYTPGVYKIYMVSMAETPDKLANVRVYTEERIEMCVGLKDDSQRGLVEMAVTKHLTALQALLDWQAQSKHLSIYVEIELSERGKQHNALYAVATKNNKRL